MEFLFPVQPLSGGVLSGETGQVVGKAAEERAEQYGMELKVSEPGSAHATTEFAMLGAAAFAAGEYLFDMKREGLNRIQAKVASLKLGETLELNDDKTEVVRPESMKLAQYALDADSDVIPFLDAQASSGLYRTQASAAVYTRWAIGEDSQS